MRDYYSEDQGLTWTKFNYKSGLTTTFQDTFLAFSNIRNSDDMIRAVSTDKGITWESDTILSMQMNKVGEKGDTLISFFQNRIAYSPDHGKSWIKTEWVNFLNCYTPTNCLGSVLNGYANGVLIAQSANAMHVSGNLGETWKMIKNVPFGDSLFHPLDHIEGYAEGGGEFRYKDGYLYAFKRYQGVWRTPFDPIADALPSTTSAKGQIAGRVYKDLNKNCLFDLGIDKPIVNKLVRFHNSFATTDRDGNYSAYLPVGNVEIITSKPNYHEQNCLPSDTVLQHIDSSGLHYVDFAFQPYSGIYDLDLNLSVGTPPRPGFPNVFFLTVKNVGTESVSGALVTFNFDPAKYEVIDAGNGIVDNGTITFYQNLEPDECVVFRLILRLLPNVQLGTIDIVTAGVDLSDDVDLSSNKVILERVVVGSYDPNDKTAFTAENILPFTENEVEYLIRFQNTGTDTAFTVRVADTLDAKFDLLTLEMIATSHPFELKMKNNGAVQWIFQNILLPDSTTNEPLSHGFIHFLIKTKSDVSDSDTLRNEASIYFDFNERILTNEVIDKVKKGIFTQTDSLTICEGDEVNGVPIFESSIFSDTLSGNVWDSVFVTQIEVLPVYWIVQNLSFSPGDTFSGIPVYVDTVFVENFIAQNGCDSIVTTNLSIVSGVEDLNSENGFFKVFPNPILDEMTVEVFSDLSTHSEIIIYDVLGKSVLHQAVKLKIGHNSISVDVNELQSGILTVKLLRKSGDFQTAKVLRIRD